jgi:hypothetical protein
MKIHKMILFLILFVSVFAQERRLSQNLTLAGFSTTFNGDTRFGRSDTKVKRSFNRRNPTSKIWLTPRHKNSHEEAKKLLQNAKVTASYKKPTDGNNSLFGAVWGGSVLEGSKNTKWAYYTSHANCTL